MYWKDREKERIKLKKNAAKEQILCQMEVAPIYNNLQSSEMYEISVGNFVFSI